MTQNILSIPDTPIVQLKAKRDLLRQVNKPAGKLTAIQSMALRLTDLDPSNPESADQILRLAESIGMLAEEAMTELGNVAQAISEQDS